MVQNLYMHTTITFLYYIYYTYGQNEIVYTQKGISLIKKKKKEYNLQVILRAIIIK